VSAAVVEEVPVEEILGMRDEYRREMDCQIVHDSWHARGFTRSYLLRAGDAVVGYGSVGGPPGEPQEIVKEFHLRKSFRGRASALFCGLVAASGARWIEAQTNDVLLTLMLHDFATDLTSDRILFDDGLTTAWPPPPGANLRALESAERERVFEHTVEPVGDWGLESDGAIVATGGFLSHYNPPWSDIHMEVAAPYRRRGFGSYLVQELKRICRKAGKIPGARCRADNQSSRRALERAGMLPCARIVRGRIAG
jgi:GNAT superfamily N-acetyltransferase